MSAPVRGELDSSGLRIGIVRSLFNQPVTDGLLRGATEVLEEAGDEDVTSIDVEGAFEVPVVAQRLVSEGCDAIIALGAVIAATLPRRGSDEAGEGESDGGYGAESCSQGWTGGVTGRARGATAHGD